MKMRLFYFLLVQVFVVSFVFGQTNGPRIGHVSTGGFCPDCPRNEQQELDCFEITGNDPALGVEISIPYSVTLRCLDGGVYPPIELRVSECDHFDAFSPTNQSVMIDTQSGSCDLGSGDECDFITFSGVVQINVPLTIPECEADGDDPITNFDMCGVLFINNNYMSNYSGIIEGEPVVFFNDLYDEVLCYDHDHSNTIDYSAYGVFQESDNRIPSLLPPMEIPVCCENIETNVDPRSSISSELKSDIIIHPNPIGQNFSISNISKTTKVEIISTLGKVIYTQNTDNKSLEIDSQKWESGIYLVVISENGIIRNTKKVMKN